MFAVKGRGTVVTGTLRGGRGDARDGAPRLVPGDERVRVREVQVHGQAVDHAAGGRTALLLGGVEADELRRGQVLAGAGRGATTSRMLVALRPALELTTATSVEPPANEARLQLHLGTEQVAALVVRSPRESAVRTDRLAVRDPAPGPAGRRRRSPTGSPCADPGVGRLPSPIHRAIT